MNILWSLLGVALLFYLFGLVFRGLRNRGDRSLIRTTEIDRGHSRTGRGDVGARIQSGGAVRTGQRDLGANVNPSQLGNEVDLWPDRTGPQTRRELGARHATDVTFAGDRIEHKDATRQSRGGGQAQAGGSGPADGQTRDKGRIEGATQIGSAPPARSAQPATEDVNAMGDPQSDPSSPHVQPGTRVHERPGTHEHGPGTNPAADLAPEDHLGEDRPAARKYAPDAEPTQWHPDEHGVPGDHIRDGHHRSATAPERRSDATDPFAHAPVPGPNHVPPEGGIDFPDNVRP